MRGASYGDRAALLAHLARPARRAPHPAGPLRAARARAVPRPDSASSGQELDTWLVLRGGIKQEQFWIEWLTEYLEAHGGTRERLPAPPRPDHDRRPHPAQPRGDGLDAHRSGGLRLGPAQAGGVLRRARPRRRRPDRHRRLRADQARLAEAVRQRADHPAPGRAAQAGHRRGPRGGRRDRDAGAARRPLRLHAVLAVGASDTKSPITPFRPSAMSTKAVDRTATAFARSRRARAAGGVRRRRGHGLRGLPDQPVPRRAHQRARRRSGAVRRPGGCASRSRSCAAPASSSATASRSSTGSRCSTSSRTARPGTRSSSWRCWSSRPARPCINTGIGWHEARVPTIITQVPRGAWTWTTAQAARGGRRSRSARRTGSTPPSSPTS